LLNNSAAPLENGFFLFYYYFSSNHRQRGTIDIALSLKFPFLMQIIYYFYALEMHNIKKSTKLFFFQ